MSDPISEFLVSIGFKVDEAEQRKVEQALKRTEAAVTSTVVGEAQKRTDAEQRASDTRLSIAQMLGRMLGVEEQKHADTRDKTRQKEQDKDDVRQAVATKRRKEALGATIKQAETAAVSLAAFMAKVTLGFELTAAGVAYGIDRAAASLSKMNYTADWAGATVKGMSAFVFAATQLGDSAEDAEASVVKFGRTLKTIPAYEGVVNAAGVKTRDAAGNWRDMAEVAAEYGATLKTLPQLQRDAKAGMLGLSDRTANVLVNPRFAEIQGQEKADQEKVGNDRNANAAAGTRFTASRNRLADILGGLGERVTGDAIGQLQPKLDALSAWVLANGDRVAAVMTKIIDDIIRFATAIAEDLGKVDWTLWLTRLNDLGDGFDKIAKSLTGESGATVAVSLFGLAIATKLLAPLGSLVNLLGLLSGSSGLAVLTRLFLLNPAVFGTAAVGAVLASGDPNKSVLAGGNPNLGPRDNDLGLPGLTNDPDLQENKSSSAGSGNGLWGRIRTFFGYGNKGAHLGQRRGSDAPVPSTPAPGANSFGNINAPYRAPLDAKGEKGFLAPRELFAYLKAQGASDNEALMLTGAAGNESSFNPNAVHDGGHGHGLWGHNDQRVNMQGRSWQEQARLALNEVKHGGYAASVNGAKNTEELAVAEMHYERPREYSRGNPRGGDNYTGRFHTLERFASMTNRPQTASTTAVNDAEVFAARQRLAAGGNAPADRALVQNYIQQQNTPSGSGGAPVKVDVTKQPLDPARQKLADAMKQHAVAEKLVDLMKSGKLAEHLAPWNHHHRPLGMTNAHLSMNDHRRGDTHLTHNPVFHIQGGETKAAMDHARMMAGRGTADMLRSLKTAEV